MEHETKAFNTGSKTLTADQVFNQRQATTPIRIKHYLDKTEI
jgi:hypothetical protein